MNRMGYIMIIANETTGSGWMLVLLLIHTISHDKSTTKLSQLLAWCG